MCRGEAMAARYGARAVAVPGEVAGYWEAKVKYGNSSISWSRLVAPTLAMCREGIPVSWTQADKLQLLHDRGEWGVYSTPAMNLTFHRPGTGRPWREGETYTHPRYAATLEALAAAGDRGEHYLGFYTGQVGRAIVKDLGELGGIITTEDMAAYRARWVHPVNISLESLNSTLYSVPPPASGAILTFILNILDLYHLTPEDNNPLLFQRIVEAFK